jgi:hypothetical protein
MRRSVDLLLCLFLLKSSTLFIFVDIIQMHPGGSSFTSDPFVNSFVGWFLDALSASFSGASSSNPGLFAITFGFALLFISYLLVSLCSFLFIQSFCLCFAFSRPLHGLF